MNLSINNIIIQYLKYYPKEKERLSKLLELINENKNNNSNLFNRKNFRGHITASGYIYCINENKILLLKHKSLNKYLQPGGHVEILDEDIISAAKREIYEETGLKDLKLLSISESINLPLDIDSHYIPENLKKKEKEHLHHDFGYLFIVDKSSDIVLDLNESKEYRWVNFEELDSRFELIHEKIKNLVLSYKEK